MPRVNRQEVEVGTAWTTVYEEGANLYSALTLKMKNTGAAALTDCRVQSFVGPADSDWMDLAAWTVAQTLAAGALTSYDVDGVHDVVRVQAKCGTSTTIYVNGHGVP